MPADPGLAGRVRALRLEAALVQSLHDEGRYAEARARLEPAIVEATALGYGPVRAELELLRGNVSASQGHYAEAEEQLERAYGLAVEHEHSHLALSASTALAYVVGDLRERHEVGLKWGLTAEALARQPWAEPVRRAAVLGILGNIYYEGGRFGEALAVYEHALEVYERVDPGSGMITLTLANIGLVLHEQGRYEDALPILLDVLERREATLGPDHLAVAIVRHALGVTLRRMGRLDEASGQLRQALESRAYTLGPSHPELVSALNDLGALWEDLGELPRALDAYQRALSIGDALADASESDRAESWLGVARVLRAHGMHDAAARHAQHGLRALEHAVGPDHPRVGEALVTLGLVARDQGAR
ncbi:MAG: tetratricopeptide repeat protein, partial [Myxococcales bacterium]|nr:tetratricopeptide repeat protein [Myxococcales bacterium]